MIIKAFFDESYTTIQFDWGMFFIYYASCFELSIFKSFPHILLLPLPFFHNSSSSFLPLSSSSLSNLYFQILNLIILQIILLHLCFLGPSSLPFHLVPPPIFCLKSFSILNILSRDSRSSPEQIHTVHPKSYYLSCLN